MKNIVFAVVLVLAFPASGQTSDEPVLSWTVERLGEHNTRPAHQSSFSGAQLQLRTYCDRDLAARMGWPDTTAVRVTVRPHNPKPDGPSRSAEITCDEVRANRDALSNYIPKPRKPRPKTQDLIQLWD